MCQREYCIHKLSQHPRSGPPGAVAQVPSETRQLVHPRKSYRTHMRACGSGTARHGPHPSSWSRSLRNTPCKLRPLPRASRHSRYDRHNLGEDSCHALCPPRLAHQKLRHTAASLVNRAIQNTFRVPVNNWIRHSANFLVKLSEMDHVHSQYWMSPCSDVTNPITDLHNIRQFTF